ncbi:MAG: hypothetical protein ACRCZF_17480, partial [Gemmataceae bacterium]
PKIDPLANTAILPRDTELCKWHLMPAHHHRRIHTLGFQTNRHWSSLRLTNELISSLCDDHKRAIAPAVGINNLAASITCSNGIIGAVFAVVMGRLCFRAISCPDHHHTAHRKRHHTHELT